MTQGRRLCGLLVALVLSGMMAGDLCMTAMASSTDYRHSLSAGVDTVLGGEYLTAVAETKSVSADDKMTHGGLWKKEGEQQEAESDDWAQEAFGIQGKSKGITMASLERTQEDTTALREKTAVETAKEIAQAAKEETPADGGAKGTVVMANVKNSVNVRAKADEESDKVGYLYADCGGVILDRKNGWTRLESGNVDGWVSDEYLLFGKAAEDMASDVGNLIVTIKADALRVRKEPSESAAVYGVIAKDDELDVIEDMNGWISVDYEGKVGYVSEEFVDADFQIDSGETLEEIQAREAAEAAEKEKLRKAAEKAKLAEKQAESAGEAPQNQTENRGAVATEMSDEILLAALIQCESGNQPYEGQLAVGAVVMNRVRSGGYPGSVTGVIYASGQFPPALNGKVARVAESGNIKGTCVQAAQEAIAGASNVGGATHFRRAGSREGIIIGNHVFW